ncbi:MAG: HAD family hydrolase [Bacillota bacterium]
MFEEDTILLDLDGTLLSIDMDRFLKSYFKLITNEFKDIKSEEEFHKILMKATEKMIKNDGEKSNESVFKKSFFSMLNVDNNEEIMERFDYFYENEYRKLKDEFELNNNSSQLIEILKNADKTLVLATNPLFPEKAIIQRVKWAGIDADVFDYITSYEKMHYSKPNPKYYKEIIEKLNIEAKNAIMIGNNLREDMIAKKINMTTYLLTDHLIDDKDSNIEPDWQGSLEDLISKAKEKLA